MVNQQKDKTDKKRRVPVPQKINLKGYYFTYRSESTSVVPLIDFLTGLAPIQPPVTKKEKKVEGTETKNRNRYRLFIQDLLSNELIEDLSRTKADPLSDMFCELGAKLGFKDNIGQHLLEDAGIKLHRFYTSVKIIYVALCVFIVVGVVLWLFIIPSASPISPPTASPTASPTEPASVPTNIPPTASSSGPTSEPTSVTQTAPPTVPPTALPPATPATPQKVTPSSNFNQEFVRIAIIYSPFFAFFALIFLFMIIRLGILISGKKYASTLCLLACIYIVLELQQDDILSINRIKIRLINRVDFLAKYIPLVGMNISHNDPSMREWTLQYFKTMQKYVRQLELWIIAPKSDTLQSLRKDFYTMAGILLYGNYAQMDWAALTSEDQVKQKTSVQRLGSTVQRFIGIGLPILLLYVVIFYPGIIPAGIGFDKISIVAIAWFLIAIDANLKLGVIDRILEIAKAIKELT
jgi:hypothetical protein